MIGIARSVARELGSRSITANVVVPGFIETDMSEPVSHEVVGKSIAATPLRRWGESEEVAATVEFFLSPGAACTTGIAINVDGGLAWATSRRWMFNTAGGQDQIRWSWGGTFGATMPWSCDPSRLASERYYVSNLLQVPAIELPNHIGAFVKGHGILKSATLVQPGGDIVVARFDGVGYGEAAFPASKLVEVEVE